MKNLSPPGTQFGSNSLAACAETLPLRFEAARQNIVRYGGRLADRLDEPMLTHVVLDKQDKSRRLELLKRTEK